MNATQHFDIRAEQLEDGTIWLQQMDYAGEHASISMHPNQLRAVAAAIGAPAPTGSAAVFIKRLRAAHRKARDLAELIASVPSFPPQDQEPAEVTDAWNLVEALENLIEDFVTSGAFQHVTPVTRNVGDDTVTPDRNVTDTTVPSLRV